MKIPVIINKAFTPQRKVKPMAYKGKTATYLKPGRPERTLAMWIQMQGGIITTAQSVARDIANLRGKVPVSIRDYIVVYGKGLAGHTNEIIVIVKVNQNPADEKAFNELTTKVRATLPGAFEELRSYPADPLCNPYEIAKSRTFNGWHAVKSK